MKMTLSTLFKMNMFPQNLFFCNRNLLSLSSGSKRGFLAGYNLVSLQARTLKTRPSVLQGAFMPSPRLGRGFWRLRIASSRYSALRRSSNDTWSKYNKYYGRNKFNNLKKPALFTAAFCLGTSLVVPLIYNYTPLSVLKRRPQFVVYSLIVLNGVGFLMWRSPSFSKYMTKYGLLMKDRITTPWSMLGSAFSHQSFGHFMVNMFVLSSFGTTLSAIVGASNFTVMYLNSAVISSFLSLSLPALLSSSLSVASLGASGAVFGVVGAFSYLIPKAPVAFFFVPVPGGAWLIFLGTLAYNIAGMALKFGKYDYAAHVGGSIAGIAYGWWFDRKRKELQNRRRGSYF